MLQVIADELSAFTEVLPVVMDVGNQQACAALIEKTIAHFGALHILVNNAGLHHRGEVEMYSGDQLAAMVDVNLRTPIHLSVLSLPHMKAAGEGAIVNVGSLAGRVPLQGSAAYSSTKTGLRTFTYALADELRGTGVSTSVVSPGPIDTGFIMDDIDRVQDIVFSQPMSTADEVARNVIRLALNGKYEIAMTRSAGWLTNIAYLSPWLRRKLRPLMYKKGRRIKERYRKQNTDS